MSLHHIRSVPSSKSFVLKLIISAGASSHDIVDCADNITSHELESFLDRCNGLPLCSIMDVIRSCNEFTNLSFKNLVFVLLLTFITNDDVLRNNLFVNNDTMHDVPDSKDLGMIVNVQTRHYPNIFNEWCDNPDHGTEVMCKYEEWMKDAFGRWMKSMSSG
jgi:hypothetical protein